MSSYFISLFNFMFEFTSVLYGLGLLLYFMGEKAWSVFRIRSRNYSLITFLYWVCPCLGTIVWFLFCSIKSSDFFIIFYRLLWMSIEIFYQWIACIYMIISLNCWLFDYVKRGVLLDQWFGNQNYNLYSHVIHISLS